MDHDQALGIAARNLKGPRDKDMLSTAAALALLKADGRYKTTERVAEAVDVSREIVREFLNLLRLPPAVQQMFHDGRLRSLEQGKKLYQLQLRRPTIVLEAAEAMEGGTAFEARALTDYLIRHPRASVTEAQEAILASESRRREIFVVMLTLDAETYRLLKSHARRERRRIDDVAADAIARSLRTADA